MTKYWREDKISSVIIVGGGVGGSAIGALLAKANFKTTILEKNRDVGGKASIYTKDGFKLEAGVHMFSRCGKGPHGQVLKEVGAEESLQWIYNDPATEVRYANKNFLLPLYFSKPENIQKLLDFLELTPGETEKVIEMFTKMFLADENEIKKYDETDLQTFISSFTDNLAIHDFLSSVCMLYFAIPYYRASAGEFMHCFKNMFLDSSFGYIKGGSASISKAFLEAASKHGAKVNMDAQVEKILVEDGNLVGVELAEGEVFNSEQVISNAGIKETVLKLIGEKQFSKEYVKNVKDLKESLGFLSMKIALKNKVTNKPCHVVMPENAEESFKQIDADKPPKDMFLFIPVPSNLDPNLAPSGTQLLTIGTPCPEDPNTNFDPWIKRLREKISEVFPNILEEAMWVEVTTPKDIANWTGRYSGSAIGLAQSPDQTGDNRPAAVSPIKGIYYVGADVQARGIGTELAADSALKLASQIKRNP